MSGPALSLYEIAEEYEAINRSMDIWAEEHEGDVTDFPLAEQLAALKGDRAAKVLNVAVLVKSFKRWAEAHAEEAKSQAAKAKAFENRAERWRKYVEGNTNPGDKFSDSRASVYWQNNPPSVQLDAEFEAEPARLPAKFCKAPEASLSALKAAAVEETVTVNVLEPDGVTTKPVQVVKKLVRLDPIPDGEGGVTPGRVVAEVVQRQGLRIK